MKFKDLEAKKVGNQYRVPALPWSAYDKTAFMGFSAEVWIQDGKPLSQGHEMLNADPNVCILHCDFALNRFRVSWLLYLVQVTRPQLVLVMLSTS